VSGDRQDDDLDLEGLDSVERERLSRVHELLLEAGPPSELPVGMATPALGATGTRTVLAPQKRRRLAGAFALAAALAAAAFAGGYVVGNQSGDGGKTVRVAAMSGANAHASLRVGEPDAGGNWPIDFAVTGLPKQTGKYAYYEIFVLRDGKPGYPCGGFRVENGGTTTKRFWVPYKVTDATKWVVTAVDKTHRWPGRTVMTMA
jgi:hypothetical protein